MKLGVSVYPDLSSFEEIKAYLELAGKYGFTRVFSSMFSVEGTNEEIIDYFRNFIEEAHKNGMEVSLDVNPMFLKKMGVSYDDVSLFNDIHCDIIRMDMPFGKEKDLVLIQNPYGIKIEFNASMGISEELDYFVEHNVPKDRVLLGHNFYPQRYTGLKWNRFLETNKKLSKYGFVIDAFVSSTAPGTHGVWDAVCGLPTVEKMRDLPIDLQTRELLGTDNVDDVLIGNAYASEEELKAMSEIVKCNRKIEDSALYEIYKNWGITKTGEYKEKKIKVVPVEGLGEQERYNLFELFPQSDFGDSSEWIWRSRSGRMIQKSIPVRKVEGDFFQPGDVVIVNDNYAHYAGEIQIVKMPIVNDGTRNLVGKLADHEMEMLELINDGDNVGFVEVK